jgi:N-acyl-D-aspartate/D-glutamate deacylase
MEFDLLIRGGTVLDGSGAPPFTADVGVVGETIQVVGDLRGSAGLKTISARGQMVCPGFIDIHTHSDLTLLQYPRAESRTRQGITTEVVGNCSYSTFPVTKQSWEFMAPRLGISNEQPCPWKDVAGYRDFLNRKGVGVNVVPLVGHGSIRIAAMGMDDRAPTAAELNTMQRLAAQAIEQGAFGFSTGLTLAPSSFSQTEELIAISKTIAVKGGFYATHSRLWAGWHYKAVEEAIEIGRRAKLPIQVSHQTIVDPRYYGSAARIVEMMEQARADGIDVLYDVYPYVAGGTGADQLLPDWALEGGAEAMLARLRDPVTKSRIRSDAEPGWFRGIPWVWERIQIASLPGEMDELVGCSMAIAADRLNLEPLDAFLHLIEIQENRFDVIVFNRDEDDVQYFLAHPLSMIGSDGSSIAPGTDSASKPHPRYYGTYPRILGHYCRELGIMPLTEAIRKMTSAPAARLGIKDRGLLRPGMKADIVVFDAANVRDCATFDDPHQFPEGILHVVINGETVVTPNGHTGALPGRVLEH